MQCICCVSFVCWMVFMMSEFLCAVVTNAVTLLNEALDRFSFGQNLTLCSIVDVTTATFGGVLFSHRLYVCYQDDSKGYGSGFS